MKLHREVIERFVAFWTARKGAEESECEQFWDSLLVEVLGTTDVKSRIRYELPVYYDDGSTKFLDAWIPETGVLIEQKSRGIDLDAPQTGHRNLTPYQQAKEYDDNRPRREAARWIVVSNFDEIRIHDMEADRPQLAYETVLLKDLAKEAHRLQFLVKEVESIREKEARVSIEAGRVIGKLYAAFLEQSGELAKDPKFLRDLNVLCVRLVFCVYAEDAGVFAKDQFLTFLRAFEPASFHLQLRELFKVLAQRPEARSALLPAEVRAFPYVGGGLFKDDVDIPVFSEKVARLLLDDVSEHFDWSEISPTIFGAVFESTLNPETRRKGGMHYTSEENIHKVIDPLFLDDLKAELAAAKAEVNVKKRDAALERFQQNLGELKFLDPACGSGNFLTETYLSLRKLENEALETRFRGQGQLALGDKKLIHVSINQFYGIEINDFAVTVAQTAMWIAECKMMEETNAILSKNLTPLPLTDSAKIVEGNALRMDWNGLLQDGGFIETALPAAKGRAASTRPPHFDYIMGNPPFIGYSNQSLAQKDDMLSLWRDKKGKPYKTAGKIDYVTAWYWKAAELMQGTATRSAFVSTNSITQGEQVAAVWRPLKERFGLEIDFAWKTFVWDSEATEKAHVHVVVIGFRVNADGQQNDALLPRRLASHCSADSKWLFEVGGRKTDAKHINGYLLDSPDLFVENRSRPISACAPELQTGGKPTDGGHLILTREELDGFLGCAPEAQKWIRPYSMGKDFLDRKPRYCLWLRSASPKELRSSVEVLRRIEAVREYRLKSPKSATRDRANSPHLFEDVRESLSDYVAIAKVSSERRAYIPIDYLSKDVIPGDSILFVPNATLYHFGVLTSSVHMAWMRTVCGRLKSDYRYSAAIVYNNFPWPENVGRIGGAGVYPPRPRTGGGTVDVIERTAQAILDARALYPDSSLADLYDPLTMPPELRKAHAANDAAVMEAYGFEKTMSETEIVAELFKRYAALTKV